MTRKKLEAIEAAYQKAAERAEAHRLRRNAAITEAIDDGWTHAQVSDATGLARSRVSQLAPPMKRRLEAGER